jgi:hypothetical protein
MTVRQLSGVTTRADLARPLFTAFDIGGMTG